MKRKLTRKTDTLPQNVILYDGICNLCHWTVRFVKKQDKKGIFSYGPLQAGHHTGIDHITQTERPDTVCYQKDGQLYDRSDAVLLIARDLGGVWRWFYYLKIIPKPWRNGIYDLVARYRYRVFGKRDVCTLPKAGPE